MLLSDPEVIRFINANFVACWQTVRPPAQVTVDFGGGRVLRRTLGGNTLFEVRLPDGRVVDALPGVYMPADFLRLAKESLELVGSLADACGGDVDARVKGWHRERLARSAAGAAELSVGKAVVESPILLRLRGRGVFALRRRDGGLPSLAPQPGTASHPFTGEEPEAELEQLSRALADASKQPATVDEIAELFALFPNLLPGGRSPSPEELGRLAVEADSKVNLFRLRPGVHLFFAAQQGLAGGLEVRDAIFAKLLKVRVDDPYLGLADVLVPGTPAPAPAR